MTSTILPPRFEDREAELDALIPIYEEVSGSLRPTWIPLDPTTWMPPPPKKSRAGFFVALGFASIAIWAVGFAGVVGGHMLKQRYDQRTSAAVQVAETLPQSPQIAIASQPIAPQPITPQATKPIDTGVTMTVNVNDLPVSKDFKKTKRHRQG